MQVLRRGCRDSGKISGVETLCSSVVAQEREFSFGPFRKTVSLWFLCFLVEFLLLGVGDMADRSLESKVRDNVL